MTYTTSQGDMWDGIAYKTLGSCKYKDIIMRENPENVGVYVFSGGVELKIPEIDETDNSLELPPWKQVSG